MIRPQGRLPRLATLFASAAIVAAACTPAASTAPSGGAATQAPPATSGATAGAALKYPETGEVTCGSGGSPGSFNDLDYTGNLKSIEAPDDKTVVFTLCNPDVAFLQKVAFAVFGINDSGWIETHARSEERRVGKERRKQGGWRQEVRPQSKGAARRQTYRKARK